MALSVDSEDWTKDRARAEREFFAGTISEEDELVLRQNTALATWTEMKRKRWEIRHRELLREAQQSHDLAVRMLLALVERS